MARCRKKGCGSPIVERMDSIGRLTFVCLPCARNARGLCRDCDQPIAGPGCFRCVECRRRRRREIDGAAHRKLYRNNPTYREHQIQKQRRYRADPARRALEAERSRRWRETHPRGPVTAYDRLASLKSNRKARSNPEVRARQNARKRERYANDPAYRERVLTQQQARRDRVRARAAQRRPGIAA